jgi:hypothetical protein
VRALRERPAVQRGTVAPCAVISLTGMETRVVHYIHRHYRMSSRGQEACGLRERTRLVGLAAVPFRRTRGAGKWHQGASYRTAVRPVRGPADRYRSDRASRAPLMAPPRRHFARARYWLPRLKVEIVFNLVGNASVWFAGGGGGRANDSGDPFVPSGRRWVRTSDPSSIRTIHDVVCRAPPGFVLVTLPAACAAVRHCWSRLLSASLSGARALLGISDDALVCRCIYEDTDRTVSQGSLSTTPTMRPLASADGPNPRGPIGS